MAVIVKRTEVTPIKSLKTYEKNPRIGNVDAIAESLEKSGQFKPVVVNERNMQILAGNHTFLAARKLGWKEIYASFVDVDDEVAKRIVLADNKTADMGEYDDRILAELLSSLPDITGTGYDPVDVDELLAAVDVGAVLEEVTGAIDTERRLQQEIADSQTFDGSPLGEEPDPGQEPVTIAPKPTKGPLESASEKLGGVVQFTAPQDVVFEGVGPWGIPQMKTDMLMTFDDIPDNLDSWAGSATKDWPDEEQWWLYNWGIDSTSGMKDISKVVLSFYCFDDYFDNWWFYPERYVPKVLNSRIQYALTPNWSQPTQLPLVECLWNLYRARWVGRYMQEAGIKVCPDITWPDGNIDFLEDHVLSTLPVGIPLIAMQLQTVNYEEVVGGKEHFVKQIRLVLDTLQPEGVLFYAGPQGRELIDEIMVDYPAIRTKVVGTRMEKLSAAAKTRVKKTTI